MTKNEDDLYTYNPIVTKTYEVFFFAYFKSLKKI